MSKLETLKQAKCLSDLANIIGVQPKTLSYVLYKIPSSSKYKSFQILKKSGGNRTIQSPDPRLKRIQKSLSDLLQDILLELQKKHQVKSESIVSHGFKPKLSIITNARNHRNKRYVFNSDLKDFFPSINFGRVYGFFVRNKDFALAPRLRLLLHKLPATVIAYLKAVRVRRLYQI